MTIKSEPVLMLNKSWMPCHITNIKNAVGMICSGSAKVVVTSNLVDHQNETIAYEFETLDYDKWAMISQRLCPKKHDLIHTVSKVYFKPLVITIGYYGAVNRKVHFSRHVLYERDNGQCQYCGKNVNKAQATIDHIIPISKDGKNTWTNTVISCLDCNSKKGNKNLKDTGLKLKSNPKQPSWMEIKLRKAKTQRERNEWVKFIGL